MGILPVDVRSHFRQKQIRTERKEILIMRSIDLILEQEYILYYSEKEVKGIVGEDLMELTGLLADTFAVCVTCRIKSIECTLRLIWYSRIPIIHSFCFPNFD